MTCRRTLRKLPLYVGGDLSSRRSAAFAAHLEKCPECRRELDALRRAREFARTRFDSERIEWDDEAWRRSIAAAVETGARSGAHLRRPMLRPSWALALTLLAVAALSLLVWRPVFLPQAGAPDVAPAETAGGSGQDVVSVTLVSQETGLEVQWFFNRNFQLEENNNEKIDS